MIEFDFTVNESFLRYSRPITVPQRLRPHLDGSNIGQLESIKIICPDGTTLRGYIYSGWNNYTYYSQIRVSTGRLRTDPLRKYVVGERLTIRIFENSDYLEIGEG
ncbi:MAG: hypothetical protein WBC40_09040 [Halobacteriota archaeon]